MITAFKPSKPQTQNTLLETGQKDEKEDSFTLMMKTPKANIRSYCISITYCHLGHKNGGRSTIGCTRPQNNMFEKNKTSTQHTLQQSNTIHVIYHMNGTQVTSAISNHDFNTKPYVKDLRYDKTSR